MIHFIILGIKYMSRFLFSFVMCFILQTVVGLGQSGMVRTYGGSSQDWGQNIISTNNKNYVFTGITSSIDGDFLGLNKGNDDICVVKIDSVGKTIWKRVYGGWLKDWGQSLIKTSDDNIIVSGITTSNDGDFGGLNHGNTDLFIMKIDLDGKLLWKKLIGGSQDDIFYHLISTRDNGFLITGYTNSNDGDFEGMTIGDQDEKRDLFVIKFDTLGKIQWKKTFGGTNYDFGVSSINTSDNGYVISGNSYSNDGDFLGMNKGDQDIVVIKIDSLGKLLWTKSIGGKERDECLSMNSTSDGGFVLTGNTFSNDGHFQNMNKGGGDIFILKCDNEGKTIWKKTFGGTTTDVCKSVTVDTKNRITITGTTRSDDGDFKGFDSDVNWFDIFVLSVDSSGELLWTKFYGNGYFGGGYSTDQGNSIISDTEGGYVIIGETNSNEGTFYNMNKSGKRGGTYDIFVMKLDSSGVLNIPTSINEFSESTTTLSVHPNPFSNNTTVSYKVEIPSNISIELLNPLGQTIDVLRNDYSDSGTFQIPLNVSYLTSGMYSVRMRSGSMNEVFPVWVIK